MKCSIQVYTFARGSFTFGPTVDAKRNACRGQPLSNHLIEQGEPAHVAPPERVAKKLTAPEIAWIAILALFTVFITWQAKLLEKRIHERSEASALVNKRAADFALPSLDEQKIALADYRGKKKVVLSFWASWCGPCRMELPLLADFYRKYHKADSNFEILAVSVDDDRGEAEAYARKAKLPFPVLLDPKSAVADAYSVEGIPTMYVIDTNGTILWGNSGMDTAMEVRLAIQLGIDLRPRKQGETNADTGD